MHPVHLILSQTNQLSAGIHSPPFIDALRVLLGNVFLKKRFEFSLGLITFPDQLLFSLVLEELFVLLTINFGQGVFRTLPLQ
jgi:hypothetical protein